MSESSGFVELYKMRVREFLREPAILFWVFGFPILLAVGLGIAFREKPVDQVSIAVLDIAGSDELAASLSAAPGFRVRELADADAQLALRLGKVALVVVPGAELEYRFDATNPEGVLARSRVDDALQRAAGRADALTFRETLVTEPGSRYVDFLIPGLLGMNILSGGMYGIGFALVEMRSRKLLKRLAATPMKRSHFLLATIASRLTVVFVEVVLMLGFGWLAFDMVFQGSLVATMALCVVLGAGPPRRRAHAQDRGRVGPHQRRDAADVRRLGRVLLVRALPRRGPADRARDAAHGVQRRPARDPPRGRGSLLAARAHRDPRGVGRGVVRPRLAPFPLELRRASRR
jgi:hypothetical protein